MAEKSSSRPYKSPLREQQAAQTKRAILDAAKPLFERDGYAATSMASVAKASGVSLKTVYLSVGSKSNLLRELWNFLLRGDQEDLPVAQRDWYQAVLDERDPAEQLRMAMRQSREVKKRVAGISEVIRSAAPADEEIAALWSRIQSEFYDNQRAIVRSIDKKGALARGLDVKRATDMLWSLNHPSFFTLLANERGWSAEKYEQWITELLCQQLLRSD